jgi:multiple sugar transport system substrate-binding protein
MPRNAVTRRRFLVGVVGLAGLSSSALAAACSQPTAPAAKPADPKPAAATSPPKPAEAPKPAADAKPAEAAKPAAEAAKPAADAKPTEQPKPQIAPVQGRAIVLTYWWWADDADMAKIFTDAIDRFHQAQNRIQIKPDQLPTNADTQKKVLASSAVGQGPDLSFGAEAWLQDMYDGDVLLPVQDYFDRWDKTADFYPSVLDGARIKPNQPILMVPNQVLVNYLYVRTDWLQEAGLKPPDTFDEMIAAAKALTKGPDRFGFGLRGGDTGALGNIGVFYQGNGIKFVDEQDDVDFDAPAAIETTEKYVAMYTKDKSAQPSAPADRFPQLFAQFQGGKLAMLPHALHSWKTQSDALGDKITAISTPRGSVKRVVNAGVSGTIIYKGSKNPDAAWEFASFLAEPQQARDFSQRFGAAPVLQSIAGDAIYKENRFFKTALEGQPYWSQMPAWHRNWLKFRDTFVPMFQQVLKEEITPKKMHEDLAAILRAK